MARVDNNVSSGIGKKIKNLSKAKIINKLAKSKKLDFIKAKINRAPKTDFFTNKANVAFKQLKKVFIKPLIFVILIQNITFALKLTQQAISLIKFLVK